ncbi:MAG: hypothetical protein JW967_11675 [Dehalococcoidales bacterium]|nr:hypothetical protein [Dehalococcoidales bacterium]
MRNIFALIDKRIHRSDIFAELPVKKVRRNFLKSGLFLSIIAGTFFLAGAISGCSMMGGETEPEITQAVLKPTTTSIKITQPKLEQNNFNLVIKPPEQYKEYTLPIYLSASDTLHFEWTVSGVGEYIRIAITTPSGEYICVGVDGSLFVSTPDEPCEQLLRHGTIILQPHEQQWNSGYYTFHPHILDTDSKIDVKLLYWIY